MIKDILSSEEQELFLNSFWDAIELRQPKINRNDRGTWIPANTGPAFLF